MKSACEFSKKGAEIPSLLNATSEELVSGLSDSRFTSVDLVVAYLKRIEDVNSALNAVMEINPDAISIAAGLDDERARGRLRGPLHGLPVLLKGNIGTRDRMQTHCSFLPKAPQLYQFSAHILSSGSYALWNAKLRADSSLVEKLRANGLIILGKTSLSEWSMLRSTNSTKSWNAISGQGYATYFPKQCPGGSSGGNATAVDLGLAWAAVGTETSGSIVSPCERNNIVGIKPTVGLTSRYMVVPVSEHQDTVGPMTRTVEDAARLLEIIAGPDPMDAYTLSSPLSRIPKYSASCRLDRLRGKRIGIARNVLDTEADLIKHMLPAFEEATALMSSAGATIIDNADFTAYAAWKARPCNLVTRADFASNISQFFANLEHNPRQIRDLAGLREFTHSCAAEEYPKRNTHSWDIALEQELHNQSLDFAKHYQENLLFGGEGGVLGALERHQLDAIVLPTTIAYEIPALVGSPIITVPLGAAGAETNTKRFAGWDIVDLAPGVPFGISFLGRKWSEEVLIEIAYAFEQMHQVQGKLERAMKTPEPDLVNVVHSGEVPLDE